MCDGPTSADADGVSRNNQCGRQLAAFEFVRRMLDLIQQTVNEVGVVSGGDNFRGSILDNVSISNVAGVPEPSTWAMMILGFGLIGSVLRSSRRRGMAAVPA